MINDRHGNAVPLTCRQPITRISGDLAPRSARRGSRKVRKVFGMLAEVRGQGAGLMIAHELRLSPGRVCQLKYELADALSRHDYGPTPAADPKAKSPSRPGMPY